MWYNRHCNLYAISRQDAKERKKTVGNYENELEQFIYEVCYHPMWEEAAQYISAHPYALDLSRSRIKYPTSAYLENLSLEFTCNIRIAEDILSFDAVTNCSIALCCYQAYIAERTLCGVSVPLKRGLSRERYALDR